MVATVSSTQIDANNTNGKGLWGPITWNYLHLQTFLYPPKPTSEDKARIKKLFETVRDSLPCESCRTHFSEALADMDKHTGSMSELSQWLVEVHNSVNKRLNKPIKSYKDVAKVYKCDEVACPVATTASTKPTGQAQPPVQEYWAWLIVIGLFVLLMCILIKRKKG